MSTNALASGAKPKGQKAKEPLPHDFKSLYTSEFNEETLTIDQVNIYFLSFHFKFNYH